MRLSNVSIRRPVFAAVVGLLLVALGAGAVTRLPVREYPDVDAPIVSVALTYPGASAQVVERDVTRVVEDNLNGIEGIEQIESTSRDAFVQIDVEFELARDLDAAAADVRDRVSAVQDALPDDVEEPVISKASGDADAMMWITLTSEQRDRRALTDYAVRNLVDPLGVVPGVAQVIIGGERRYAMRIWLDAERMAARGVAVSDVSQALRRENVELPGGRIETGPRELTIRTRTKLQEPAEFRDLVVFEGGDYQVTLADIAEIERGAESYRSAVYRSGEPAVGLGIVRQSGSNTIEVASQVKDEIGRLATVLPEDIDLAISYDQSVFIQGSIESVVTTLFITAGLVILVIFLFLGSFKATLVPAATIPTSIVASFIVIYALGFSINTLTLLALVLAVGLVVDDAIVVLENAVRHRELGEPPLTGAMRAASEVGLAVIATTAVLLAVLLPIAAITGMIGRLFTEFALTLAAAVTFSSFMALTVGAMLASRLALAPDERLSWKPLRAFNRGFDKLEEFYVAGARRIASLAWIAVGLSAIVGACAYLLLTSLPSELAPTEDRAVFIVPVSGPEGTSLDETTEVVRQVDQVLAPYRDEGGPIEDTIAIVGTGNQGPAQVTQALVIVKLVPWGEREISQQALVKEIVPQIVTIPGASLIAINPPSLVQESFGKPIQFVISGPSYDLAYEWAQIVEARARELGSMNAIELEFNQKSPQLALDIDRRLAADLGVSVADIGEALRIFMGGTDITEYYRMDETYEVVVRGDIADRDAPADLDKLFIRSSQGGLVPLGAVVTYDQRGTAAEYRRVSREPSIVLTAVPAEGRDIGSILQELEDIARSELPAAAGIQYLGLSKEFTEASGGLAVVFALALLVVYLTLAALFESFIFPIVIMVAVPLAIAGGLAALWLTGSSFNTFSQIGLLLLIGLVAKNAILVVDFANQRRAEGLGLEDAVVEAARTRFRPILMTSIATFFGALPLALTSGPGAESRTVIGIVVLAGIVVATFVSLFLVPGLYRLVGRVASRPGGVERRLEQEQHAQEAPTGGA